MLLETKRLLRRFGLRARKGLGQHFLIDEDVLKSIVAAAELTLEDVVIEVGPGLGVLTRELAPRVGRLITVELDDRIATILQKELTSAGNVSVVNEDILKAPPESLLEGVSSEQSYKVVANLPYYITSAVLRHFLESPRKPRLMVVMTQKEVAEVITAPPGKMSLLGVSVQFYGKPEIISVVPRSAFYPVPEVESAVLRIEVYPHPPLEVDDVNGFFNLVRAGFSASRKQLPNSLSQGLRVSKATAAALLEQAGILSERRAETLSLEEWATLWRLYSREGAG